MGHQATVIIHLDAIDTIAQDRDFGKKLAAAILDKANHDPQSDRKVSFNAYASRCSETAGFVIEVHHADQTVIVSASGHTAEIIRQEDKNKNTRNRLK